MKILRKPIPKPRKIVVATLEEFADQHSLTLVLQERGSNGVVSGYSCWFNGVEEIHGEILMVVRGSGGTEREAMLDYIRQIGGKNLIINAKTVDRKEIVAPGIVLKRE